MRKIDQIGSPDINELIIKKLERYPPDVSEMALKAIQLSEDYPECTVFDMLLNFVRDVARNQGDNL